MLFLLLLIVVNLSSAVEHWFVYDRYQFPGFYIPLFTLVSSSSNRTDLFEQKNLSFALSSYENSINININQDKQIIRLNIERADLLANTFNHIIFLAIRQHTKFESYVNCKLMDSYILYATDFLNDDITFKVKNLAEGIQHIQLTTDRDYQQEIFERFGCKQTERLNDVNNATTIIGRPLIRKMQRIIEKIQQRPKRHSNQQSSITSSSDSLTIVYKPDISTKVNKDSNFYTILKISQFHFSIRYYPKERLFHIRFDNKNRTQFLLYVDKSSDLLRSDGASQDVSSTTVIFLRITSTMITCYVNCELTDQEFISDSFYVQHILRKIIINTDNSQQYDQQSTLILFNKTMDEIGRTFSCLKLDEKQDDLLPDKYAIRKFANALDVLVNNLEMSMITNEQNTTTASTLNVSAINIHSINGFGSLTVPIPNEITSYSKTCLTDDDCNSNNSSLKCQNEHCTCSRRSFWSMTLHRCLVCKDLPIGNRCFRLSNHKSSWNETIDFCRDENLLDEQIEYSMKLVSNLNRTDIALLKQSLLEQEDGEQLDYFYWIGLTSQSEIQKLTNRIKQRTPISTNFYWYDSGKTAQVNISDLWCSQNEHMKSDINDNNSLCITLTSCGLYADDCQRNYRFLCEAV
ncbi:hypothetical protein I4U23_014713 [Adineta vaga]|nr:hypothetical protein I4U23_014713 [Adineta vaga]